MWNGQRKAILELFVHEPVERQDEGGVLELEPLATTYANVCIGSTVDSTRIDDVYTTFVLIRVGLLEVK